MPEVQRQSSDDSAHAHPPQKLYVAATMQASKCTGRRKAGTGSHFAEERDTTTVNHVLVETVNPISYPICVHAAAQRQHHGGTTGVFYNTRVTPGMSGTNQRTPQTSVGDWILLSHTSTQLVGDRDSLLFQDELGNVEATPAE